MFVLFLFFFRQVSSASKSFWLVEATTPEVIGYDHVLKNENVYSIYLCCSVDKSLNPHFFGNRCKNCFTVRKKNRDKISLIWCWRPRTCKIFETPIKIHLIQYLNTQWKRNIFLNRIYFFNLLLEVPIRNNTLEQLMLKRIIGM